MIYWITGRKNSGKTTLAHRLAAQTDGVVLDGDEIRDVFGGGFTNEDRYNNIMLIARIALVLERQGRTVIVACVSPKRSWRKEAQALFSECLEICLPFGELWEGTTYEEPNHA